MGEIWRHQKDSFEINWPLVEAVATTVDGVGEESLDLSEFSDSLPALSDFSTTLKYFLTSGSALSSKWQISGFTMSLSASFLNFAAGDESLDFEHFSDSFSDLSGFLSSSYFKNIL